MYYINLKKQKQILNTIKQLVLNYIDQFLTTLSFMQLAILSNIFEIIVI